MKKYLYIVFGLSVSLLMAYLFNEFAQESLKKSITKSEATMVRADAIRFSFKTIILLQKSELTLLQAVVHKDEEKLYDSLDYIEAAQGFLSTACLDHENIKTDISAILEEIYTIIEKSELSTSQKELDLISFKVQYVAKEMELLEKDMWVDFKRDYIEFQTLEQKLYNIYLGIIVFISVLLFIFILIILKQKRLNSTILEHEKELKKLAYFDTLTKIPNRKSIEAMIVTEISRCKRNGDTLYVALIDIDDFKKINDMYGHESGDSLLVECVKRIQSSMRSIDTIGRFGGDEFIILFSGIEHYSALVVILERIKESFKKPIYIENKQHFTSVSIGISSYPADADNLSGLIKNADIAMYNAKAKGKAQHSFFEHELADKIERQYEMEPQIKEALSLDQFELYYQPQIDIKTDNIVSAEALVRWNHPEKGMLYPGSFIDIIEDGYMTKEFGEWVISEAARQQKEWLLQGINLSLSVNLSVKHIMSPSFYEDIMQLVTDLEINLERFAFEITEYELLRYKERSVKVLNDLVLKGFRFHLDDYGTGYSSITYLNDVKIELIKIDKSFIDKITDEEKKFPFVDAMIEMAKALNIKIIAEGVEHKYQQLYLKDLECDLIQGYYYSKPLSVNDLENYFREGIL